MRKLVLMVCLTIISGNVVLAQDESFQEWLKKDQASFQQFLKEEDRAFSEFLKKDWEAFLTQQGLKPYSKPKPVKMPVADEHKKPKPQKPLPKVKKLPPPPPKPKPIVRKKAPKPPVKKVFTVQYYGRTLELPEVKSVSLQLTPPLNNDKISNVWTTLASVNHDPLLTHLSKLQKELSLNGWGFLELVHTVACKLTRNDENACTAYTWFLMNKLGFKAKVAFKKDRLFLLMPSDHLMYERPFITVGKEKFYFISFNKPLDLSGKVYTYRSDYKKASKNMALAIQKLPQLSEAAKEKIVRFTFKGQSHTIKLQFNGGVVDFFKRYPQTEIVVYFKAPASQQLRYSLISQLRPLVKNLDEWNAVNLLLRFVQTAFNYKTDDQQFGHEKYMLPDETVFYPSSDCEDRAILFAFLVRNLLGLEVIGLDYPNHIATAVNFHSQVPGKYVMFKGKKFVICDPTYINADAGMVMPELAGIAPKVISF